MRRTALALALLALPAWAEDSPLDPAIPAAPGAVSLYLQALDLAELGTRGQDPLLVLAAARILHGLTLVDTSRTAEPPAPPQPVTSPDAAALLDLARLIDAGAMHADLIDRLAREVSPAPRALQATAATLAPGETQTWTLPFFGGVASELAILAQGSTHVDSLVSLGKDTQICLNTGSAPAALCSFALRENGDVTVTVTNPGAAPAAYLLLTE